MRRRRINRGAWFPVFGTPFVNNEGEDIPIDKSGVDFIFSVGGTTSTGFLQPLTPDGPATTEQPVLGGPGLLNDIMGQEYFLKRIVGKFHAAITTAPSSSDVTENVKLVAGFCVARSNPDDFNQANGCVSPYSSEIDPNSFNNFSPNANATMREPWIWRRSWILGNPTVAQDSTITRGAFPRQNYSGSVLDGPHIDAKTKRRITSDDRLFFAATATPWPYGTLPSTSLTVTAHLDVRIFAQMRKARNRGNF